MNLETKVVNCKSQEFLGTPTWNRVYIGRPSEYGNPFVIGKDGTREEVIQKYRNYFADKIINDNDFKDSLLYLKGKILGCFCSPQACHGDIIKEYLDLQG